MKIFKIGMAALGLALSALTSQASITLDVANQKGDIQFQGSTLSFVDINGGSHDQFVVTSSSGVGDSVNLKGWITGSWTIGSITTIGGVQTATVTGTGVFHLSDGTQELTANLTWQDISTVGTSGNLNTAGAINLSNISYSGLNQDLLDLKASGSPTIVLSYSFIPGKTLTQLTSGGVYKTGFSGQVSAVPEPSTVVAAALLLLPFGASTIRSIRKNRAA